jgi:hypothetical protein
MDGLFSLALSPVFVNTPTFTRLVYTGFLNPLRYDTTCRHDADVELTCLRVSTICL